jgi:hypothetical protein
MLKVNAPHLGGEIAFAHFGHMNSLGRAATYAYALAGFFVDFSFRPRGGYKRLASSTLMTLTDMLFSRCLDFATFRFAASSLRRLYQRGTLPCPRLGGDAALPGTPLLMQDQHCIL